MKAPTYDWVCQRCGNENRAHVAPCAGCGKSAYFKAPDLPRPSRSAPALSTLDSHAVKEGVGNTLVLFFPEIIPAFGLALYGPYWAFKRLASGDVLRALGLLAAEAICIYLFIALLKRGAKFGAHASMVAFVFAAWAAGMLG